MTSQKTDFEQLDVVINNVASAASAYRDAFNYAQDFADKAYPASQPVTPALWRKIMASRPDYLPTEILYTSFGLSFACAIDMTAIPELTLKKYFARKALPQANLVRDIAQAEWKKAYATLQAESTLPDDVLFKKLTAAFKEKGMYIISLADARPHEIKMPATLSLRRLPLTGSLLAPAQAAG